jgi:hypothetical protein
MSTRPARHLLPIAVLAAALAACGGQDDATAHAKEAEDAAGPVYTSEVESVSRWIQQGGGNADSAGLVAAPNPRGEGILVYSQSADSASGGDRAAWVVVDSQVVPLNQASRRTAPERARQAEPESDARTWKRIGIEPAKADADVRDILPVPTAPPARRRASEREPAREREAPSVPAADAAPPVPFPTPRVTGPRDTLRVPDGPAEPAQTPVRRDTSAGDPADTLRIPSPRRPVRDTIRIPGPSANEAEPVPAAPAAPAPALPAA